MIPSDLVGTPRNPGDLDPDDPYAQTAPARPSFGDAAGGTAAYDGASLRAADEQPLGQYDSTRGSPRVDPTGVMPGPRNVTHAVAPVRPVQAPLAPRMRLGGAMPPVSAMPPTVAHPAVAPLPPTPAPTPAAPAVPAASGPRSSTGLMIALVLLGMTLGVAVAVVLLRG